MWILICNANEKAKRQHGILLVSSAMRLSSNENQLGYWILYDWKFVELFVVEHIWEDGALLDSHNHNFLFFSVISFLSFCFKFSNEPRDKKKSSTHKTEDRKNQMKCSAMRKDILIFIFSFVFFLPSAFYSCQLHHILGRIVFACLSLAKSQKRNNIPEHKMRTKRLLYMQCRQIKQFTFWMFSLCELLESTLHAMFSRGRKKNMIVFSLFPSGFSHSQFVYILYVWVSECMNECVYTRKKKKTVPALAQVLPKTKYNHFLTNILLFVIPWKVCYPLFYTAYIRQNNFEKVDYFSCFLPWNWESNQSAHLKIFSSIVGLASNQMCHIFTLKLNTHFDCLFNLWNFTLFFCIFVCFLEWEQKRSKKNMHEHQTNSYKRKTKNDTRRKNKEDLREIERARSVATLFVFLSFFVCIFIPLNKWNIRFFKDLVSFNLDATYVDIVLYGVCVCVSMCVMPTAKKRIVSIVIWSNNFLLYNKQIEKKECGRVRTCAPIVSFHKHIL